MLGDGDRVTAGMLCNGLPHAAKLCPSVHRYVRLYRGQLLIIRGAAGLYVCSKLAGNMAGR